METGEESGEICPFGDFCECRETLVDLLCVASVPWVGIGRFMDMSDAGTRMDRRKRGTYDVSAN
jgi:hypothetical protein